MSEPKINFEDLAKGKISIELVDKLENLRLSLESNTLTVIVNKNEI